MTQMPGGYGQGGVELEYGAPQGRNSGLAIASMVVGIVSLPMICAFGLGVPVGWVALVLGIVALVKVKSNPMMLRGGGFAITGIVTGGISGVLGCGLAVAMFIPSLGKARELSNRAACAANLRGIVQAMQVYAADNGGAFPVMPYAPYGAGNAGTSGVVLTARNETDARRALLANPSPQAGSPLAGMWMLVIDGQVLPRQFVCKSDKGSPGALTDSGGQYYGNFQADDQISYSVAYPRLDDGRVGPWWKDTGDDKLPLMADMGPVQGTGTPRRDVTTVGAGRARNSGNHGADGENVAFADCHVDFCRDPEIRGDNIYTESANPSFGPSAGGVAPMVVPPGLRKDVAPYDIFMVPARNLDTGILW